MNIYLLSFSRFWTLSIERLFSFISIYFEWRDNQQLIFYDWFAVSSKFVCPHTIDALLGLSWICVIFGLHVININHFSTTNGSFSRLIIYVTCDSVQFAREVAPTKESCCLHCGRHEYRPLASLFLSYSCLCLSGIWQET